MMLIFKEKAVYNTYSYIFITISTSLFIIGIIKNNDNLKIISYIIGLITILIIRNVTHREFRLDFYLFKWLKLIFTNQTVFINIFGNIFLYIPLYLLLLHNYKSKQILIIILVLIFIMELFQYIFAFGVFDINDIILNITGVLLIYIIIEVKKWMTTKNITN